MKKVPPFVLLTAITLVAAFLLAVTNSVTEGPIAVAAAAAADTARRAVLPAAETFAELTHAAPVDDLYVGLVGEAPVGIPRRLPYRLWRADRNRPKSALMKAVSSPASRRRQQLCRNARPRLQSQRARVYLSIRRKIRPSHPERRRGRDLRRNHHQPRRRQRRQRRRRCDRTGGVGERGEERGEGRDWGRRFLSRERKHLPQTPSKRKRQGEI